MNGGVINRRRQLPRSSRAMAFIGCALLAITGAEPAAAAQLQMRATSPVDVYRGIDFIVDRFKVEPLIAVGEAHRNQQVHDFIQALVTDPRFADRVDTVVVEFGSAAHQAIVDRFTQGRAVGAAELRLVWRDTVDILLWDAPVYERFFRTIRAINKRRPHRQLRVLLAGVPIDWRNSSTADWERFAKERDQFAADLIEREVLSKGKRALLIFRARHVTRQSAFNRYDGGSGRQPNVAELLELRHPLATFLILADSTYWSARDLDGRVASWPTSSILLLRDGWLGSETTGPPGRSPRLRDLAHAILTLGSAKRLTTSIAGPELYRDAAYLRELIRRDQLQGAANAMELEELRKRVGK